MNVFLRYKLVEKPPCSCVTSTSSSFVTSLFTVVPLDECVDLYVDLVFEDCDTFIFKDCKFNRDHFRKFLNFAVEDHHFVFNGQLYDQLDGVAMGSPLGPSMANIFMCALEQKYLNGCPSEFQPVLYHRYVDDTFCLFRHREHVDKFLAHINNFHPSITFTVEVEENNSLPFLDVLVTHEQGGFLLACIARKHSQDFILIMLPLPLTNIRSI